VRSKKTREERLFGAACLRLTLERGSGHGAAGSEIYRETLMDLELTDADVDAYLESHRDAVVAALAARRGSKDEGS
jgi:hypothetical protein